MDMREPGSRFTFGVFEFDVRAGELRKRGARVRLSGQPLQILAALVARAGDIVSRDELRQQLWPDDTFVEFDHSLNTAVKRLREALGDDASTPRFIETIPRRGYRFVAPVERVNGQERPGLRAGTESHHADRAEPPAEPVPPSRARRVRRVLVASGLAAAAIAAVCAIVVWQRPSPPDAAAAAVERGRVRLAVLPFTNLTGDADRQYVAEGLTEEIVAQLGRLAPARLAVIARSSTTWPDGARPPLPEIARALQVDYVIEGSVRSVDDRYRIAVRLVETKALSTVWSELHEGPILDLVAVERRVSVLVGRHLALALTPDDPAVLARATTSSSPAFEAYLRGLYQLARGPEEGLRESVRLFQRAIDDDPAYAIAYAGLSEAHLRLQDYLLVDPARALAPARAAALKAIELDERLPEAHCALGDVLSTMNDMSGAERAFLRSLAINPSHAATYERYAWHLARVGRAEEGQGLLDRARELAPRSADVATTAAYFELTRGRFESAAALARAALSYEPDYPFARYVLGRIALEQGTPGVAIDEFSRARSASRDTPKYLAALVRAYLAAGRIDDASRTVGELRVIARTRYVPPDMLEQLDASLAARASSGS
jgi:TolB-like protein/DNA-binding winged helix-turn-helix (wHTH) protein/Tfp pilus assembly protein PilF